MNALVKTNGVEMKLDMPMVREYLCPEASDKEIFMFLKICQIQQLNPFLREVYLIKSKDHPAFTVVSVETFRKRAFRHPKYRGHTTTCSGDLSEMTATTEVCVEGYNVPVSCTVDYDEYVARNGYGSPNKIWKAKPRTMLKKVSEAQALRTAFPDECGGLYSIEEINSIDPQKIPSDPVVISKAPIVISKPVESQNIAENVQDWADKETNVARLSEKHNAIINSDPQGAAYIKANIQALQNGGPEEAFNPDKENCAYVETGGSNGWN